ncbi:MAG: right-handed parallel beta-helix repeat-containing protein [Pirellulaceae bacterium]|nr:right-handed parallel beta-helix repeat-containing protein [Pirellulaceae bacterium]
MRELKPGTTLKLAAGRYAGDRSVRDIARLTIEAADPKNPPEFVGGNAAWHFSRCQNLTVKHLRISGQRSNGLNIDDGGQLDKPTTELMLENLQISDIGPKGNHDGIKMSGIDRFVVRECHLHGWGGQGIDMVGCHHGLIEKCRFEGKAGFTATAGVQTKGGSSDITITQCHFVDGGERPVNVGGSTGLAYFRPQGVKYEAARITVHKNTFEGSSCAAAFVGVDGGLFEDNTILYPKKWVFRILQETTLEGFVPSRRVKVQDNRIVFRRADVQIECNVGGGTDPDSFIFSRNRWFAEDRPAASKPRLPTEELGGVYGVDPR